VTAPTTGAARLLTYVDLPAEIRTLSLRYLLTLARKGEFVRPVRVSPHAPPLWPEDDVREFVAAKVRAAREVGQ
jgi:hypothetical protein